MKVSTVMPFGALALIWGTSGPAIAAHKIIEGRTGLPHVREGVDNIWMNRGVVQINAVGSSVVVRQRYQLQYPGPPLETGPQKVVIGVREDYYRSTAHDAPKVTPGEAKGFTSFAVMMDGHRISPAVGPWTVNDKQDTATRWHTLTVRFRPGQKRRMVIVSSAPLGRDGNRRYAEFASHDLGGWRGAPGYLELRFSAPGKEESRLAALSPRPNQVNVHAVQWVYRKARPHRDIYLQMPINYGRMARR